MKYRAPEKLFEYVENNAPIEHDSKQDYEYSTILSDFLSFIEDKIVIGDEIEFPDLDGKVVTFEKKFPRKGN